MTRTERKASERRRGKFVRAGAFATVSACAGAAAVAGNAPLLDGNVSVLSATQASGERSSAQLAQVDRVEVDRVEADRPTEIRPVDNTTRPLMPARDSQDDRLVPVTPVGDAGEEPDYDSGLRGLSAELLLKVGYDSNVRRVKDNPDSAFFSGYEPRIRFERPVSGVSLQLGYDGNYALFDGESRENYDDHQFFGSATVPFTKKFRTTAGGGLTFGHDARGASEARLLQSQRPDRWRSLVGYLEAKLGRRIAKAEVSGRAERQKLRYLNNEQSLRNLDRSIFSLTGYYNIAPKLSVVVQPSLAYVDYVTPGSVLDSRELSLVAGVRWDATAQTSGEFKVGVEDKSFDDGSIGDSRHVKWDGKVTWEPRTFSKIQVSTGQGAAESTQAGASLVTRYLEGQWIYGITRRLTFDTGFRAQQARFSDSRRDRSLLFWKQAEYELLRWLYVGGSLEHTRHRSSAVGADYDDTRMMLRLSGHWNRRVPGRTPRGY